jgi:VWFA-related protein
VALFATDATVAAQVSPAIPSIQVNTRIVYVDVVVRDKSGNVVRGLQQQNFHALEDGRPQSIEFFLEHAFNPAPVVSAVKKLTPAANVEFRNVETSPGASSAVNVILLDLLNTPATDQIDARRQLLKFLKSMPAGQQVALFVLTNQLRMIQSFTGSTERLTQAASEIDPTDFHFIRSETEKMQDKDFEVMLGPSAGALLAKVLAQEDAINRDQRAQLTIAALEAITRATSGYSGRKNLLWLSDDFPLAVGAQLTEQRYQQYVQIPGYRETVDEIANANLAVYPISLKGLQTEGVSANSSGIGSVSPIGGPSGSLMNPQANALQEDQFNGRAAHRETLEELARQTGGEAFVGTNDFATALRRSMLDGSNYYTLAYHPQNGKWDGRFRKINISVDDKNYSLTYRRGYLADLPKPAGANSVQQLNAAMQPGTPESTMLLLRSRLHLPDATHPTVRADSTLSVAGIAFATSPDGAYVAELLVLLVAFKDGKQQSGSPPQTSGVLQLHLTPEQYATALSSGIPFEQELFLSPGSYRLRLGVTDHVNQHMGTLDMPAVVPVSEMAK